MDEKQWREIIPEGEENAVLLNDLAERWTMSRAAAKLRIKNARLAGVEICSTTKGYFFAKDDREREKFVRMQEQNAKSRFMTSKVSRKKLNEYKGQMQIAEDPEETEGGRE